MKKTMPWYIIAFSLPLLFTFQNCGETQFRDNSTSRLNSTDPVTPFEGASEDPAPNVVYKGVGCAPGFEASQGKYKLPCDGDNSCWKKKADAESSTGAPIGAADGARFGWSKWYVQCEMQHEQLPSICQDGAFAWKGKYKMPCKSTYTCWRLKSDGFVEGLVDGAQYGWDKYFVQCGLDSPQL